MVLNLEPYQAKPPYPQLGKLKRSRKKAAMLLQGYSGEYSELTTVLQYNYHSLCCAGVHRDVALTLRGIFYVETLHLELLGECLLHLGTDPRYLLPVQQKAVHWQSCVVDYCKHPGEMLLADIEGEKLAANYYLETAQAVGDPHLSPLLLRLAEDEKLHVRMLTDLHRRYFSR